MATESPFFRDGANTTAAADLSTKQFFAVKLTTTSRTTNIVAAATDLVYGILQNKPKSAQACDVCLFGITKAVAGGSVTAGHLMGVDTSGRIVEFATGAGNTAVGYTLETGVVSQVITMFFFPEVKISSAT
jgi:hypothetical protein